MAKLFISYSRVDRWAQELGRKFNTDELTQRVTGQDMSSAPYIAYLQRKFGAVYGL